MVSADLTQDQYVAALAAAEDETATPVERAEMLMEIAMGLQNRPKTAGQLHSAVELFDRALAVCPEEERLLRARIIARKGTALQAIPADHAKFLEAARAAYREASPILAEHGIAEEIAELEMNLGLVLQSLAGMNKARITDAISAYQRALRTFDKQRFPQEFAILQNNLATAFLSIPLADERGKMREALAVQAFEEGLRIVNMIDHPAEYAMLQNNLGNALQYASSAHQVENNLRALQAYDEALKVRNHDTTPVEYANTITNKANCLQNLPDDPENPQAGNRGNLGEAVSLYHEAAAIFRNHGDNAKAALVAEAASQIKAELQALQPANGTAMQHENA